MARTKTVIDQDRLLKILSEVEGENGLSNRGTLYKTIADRYNEGESVKNGEFKNISHTIVKWRLDDAGVSLKTPLGKRTAKPKPDPTPSNKQQEILSQVEDNISITEETPDGGTVEPPKTKKNRKKKNNDGLNIVKVPVRPPLPLTCFDEDSIISWVSRQREVYARNDEYYTIIAAQHDVRKNIAKDDNELARSICDVIRSACTDEYTSPN